MILVHDCILECSFIFVEYKKKLWHRISATKDQSVLSELQHKRQSNKDKIAVVLDALFPISCMMFSGGCVYESIC